MDNPLPTPGPSLIDDPDALQAALERERARVTELRAQDCNRLGRSGVTAIAAAGRAALKRWHATAPQCTGTCRDGQRCRSRALVKGDPLQRCRMHTRQRTGARSKHWAPRWAAIKAAPPELTRRREWQAAECAGLVSRRWYFTQAWSALQAGDPLPWAQSVEGLRETLQRLIGKGRQDAIQALAILDGA